MIDLHSHVLPGLDDGPTEIEGSLALARAAASAGTRTLVATPHIRDDHPFPIEAIEERVGWVNAALTEAEVDLQVLAGAEVAISKVGELDDATLQRLCLGAGPYLLVESPYTKAPDLVERVLFDLQTRGFRPILAHPERSPSFLTDLERLRHLVESNVLCSITALSMVGAFGAAPQSFSIRLFAEGLVHNVASDAHDPHRRPPGLRAGFERLDADLPGLAEQADWFTREAPKAIVAGQDLPAAPSPPELGGRWRRRLSLRRLSTAVRGE